MSQIMKAFTGIFMVMFMMVTATGLLGAFFQTLHAQNLHAAMIDELENSDYAKPVMIECFSAASEAGYEVELTLYTENDGLLLCNGAESLPTETEQVTMAEVVLRYPFQIAFFQIDMKQELFGYAR